MSKFEIHTGDCLDVMRTMPEASIDAIVTDPPYELGFMGKSWDKSGIAFRVETWAEAYRILKPGGYLAAFSGTRTYHRMAVAIEDAGFDIRDQLAWTYGTGFPKSHDISKAIDKMHGAEREKTRVPFTTNVMMGGIGVNRPWKEKAANLGYHELSGDEPVTDDAKRWKGWGTALKPAWEPICLARKTLIGTVAANVLAHGTGALNIDGCRVEAGEDHVRNCARSNVSGIWREHGSVQGVTTEASPLGRFPANLMHDGSTEVTDCFPNDTARFFYCAKASKADRNAGCESNVHPTVKPTDLMRWLCRLVTPPGGVVFDPFTGSGSTGRGALLEGFRFIGAELSEDYVRIANLRISEAIEGKGFL